MAFRIEKFIDRRADRDDHRPRTGNLAGLAGEAQALIAQRISQQFSGAIFDKGQAAAFQRGEVVEVQIVDVDAQALRSKRQHQRNAHMSRATDNSEIRGSGVGPAGGFGKFGNCHGFSP